MPRLAPLTLAAAASLLALPALAQPAPVQVRPTAKIGKPKATGPDNLKIDNLRITSVRGDTVEIVFGGLIDIGRSESQVSLWFVDGARRHKLDQRKVRFSSQRGGFPTTLSANLRGRAVHRGSIEAVIDACQDKPHCRKQLDLRGGDIKLDGSPTFRNRGRDGEVSVEVTNAGPNNATACKALLVVGERTIAEQPVRALARGQKVPVRFSYAGNQRNKNAKIRLDCRDLVPTNNLSSLRLR